MVFNFEKIYNNSYKCKSEHWMETEFDENVLDYWILPTAIIL